MCFAERLTEVWQTAQEIPCDETAKFVFLSDCHRGDNSWADDFAHNQNVFFHALEHYYDQGFTYVEVGDGDELWENHKFEEIRQAHSHVFWLLDRFHRQGRFHLIFGNHDMERRYASQVERTLCKAYYNVRTRKEVQPFEGIQVHEGLVLRYSDSSSEGRIFVVHGHQVDPINDRCWRFSRFVVRHFWRHLQLVGIRDPTSPAKNYKKRQKIEDRIEGWVKDKGQMIICGHTHRSRFPDPDKGEVPFFNTGSCVHPRCITGLEIEGGQIVLVKWWVRSVPGGGLHVVREPMEGPRPLGDFFS